MKNNPLLESVRPVYTSGQVADKINFEQNVVTIELCPCQRILFLFLYYKSDSVSEGDL